MRFSGKNCLLKGLNKLLDTGVFQKKGGEAAVASKGKGVAIQPTTSICLLCLFFFRVSVKLVFWCFLKKWSVSSCEEFETTYRNMILYLDYWQNFQWDCDGNPKWYPPEILPGLSQGIFLRVPSSFLKRICTAAVGASGLRNINHLQEQQWHEKTMIEMIENNDRKITELQKKTIFHPPPCLRFKMFILQDVPPLAEK